MILLKEYYMNNAFKDVVVFTDRDYLKGLVKSVNINPNQPLTQQEKAMLNPFDNTVTPVNFDSNKQERAYNYVLEQIREITAFMNQCDYLSALMYEITNYIPDMMFRTYFNSPYHQALLPITVGEYAQIYLDSLNESLEKVNHAKESKYDYAYVERNEMVNTISLLKENNIGIFSEEMESLYTTSSEDTQLVIMHCIVKYFELFTNIHPTIEDRYAHFMSNHVYDKILEEMKWQF